ncbi:MBL fold metallo-hydrolase [Herbidospora daliensis]|uniref:MBL fold metallo-hydrolase n=1 Tax=Herbidospora daliensis TaxID=295585 RepID=UPI000781BBC4|nr:MBL fold metallo-hydrolase [Herbidospora daliensis]
MNGESSVRFIGNATTVIRHNGFTLLTDPNFMHRGQRAHLGYGLTTRRLREPALDVSELPPLDAVVLSHLHDDHWDKTARDGLDHDLPVLTTEHAARRLRRQGYGNAIGLPAWRSHELHKGDRSLTITALPARHAPGAAQFLLPPVMGGMLEFTGADGLVDLRVHISGDTLLDRRLERITTRFPDVDLAIVHLGGTKILGLMLVTMDGEQGAGWVKLIDPRAVMPVHFDDYDVFTSPIEDFHRHMERAGLADRIRYVERGEALSLQETT